VKEHAKPQTTTVADRLHSAALHLLRLLRREDRASGQGPARLSALSVLVFAGPRSLNELAAAEQVKPPTMSRIVAGLERDGLVRRVPDPQDARRAVLHATARGERIVQEGRKRRVAALAARLRSLSSADLEELARAAELIEELARRR